MSKSLNLEIKAVENLIHKGRFSEALNDIVNLKKTVKKNSQEYYLLIIWENYLVIKLGNYSKAIEKLDKIIDSIKKKDFQLLLLEAILVKISILNEIGKFDEMLSTINFGESLFTDIEESTQKKKLKAQVTFLKGQYYFTKGENKIAKTLFEESITICDEIWCMHTKAQVHLFMSIIARREGDRDAAFGYVKEALQITEENEFMLIRGRAFSNLANLYNIQGNLDETLTYLQKGLELLKQVGAINDLARLKINLGVVHHFSGNLKASLSYYKEALEGFQNVGNNLTIATTIYNIGLIYNLQGQLRDALANYDYTIPLFQEVNNISLISAAYNSIGKVYFDLGLIEDAEGFLSLVYQLKDQITEVSLSKTLFYLVQVLLSRNKYKMAKDLVDELEKISQEQNNNTIKHRFLFLKGLILNEDKKISPGQIEELYLQVINEPISDQETTISAIINYCYLLIKKYSQMKNELDLERLEYYSERVSKLATKQQSKLLFAEHYWIKSIIASLKNKKEEAKEISKQASQLAKEMEFMRLLNKIMEYNVQN